MNNENCEKRLGKLEQLSEEVQSWIVEIAMNSARQADTALALKEEGIEVSVPTLSRFLRKHREKQLLEDADEMKASAATFAENGKESKFRAGTLETVRQWLYDRALVIQKPEEARALYAELVKEESKLRELELEARKVAVAEEQVKVQRLRVEAEIAVKRQKAMLVASEEVLDVASETGAVAGREVKQIGDGSGIGKEGVGELNAMSGGEKRLEEGKHDRLEVQAALVGDPGMGRSGREERWVKLFGEVMGILNRGGDPAEKVLEARFRLGEEMGCAGLVGAVGCN